MSNNLTICYTDTKLNTTNYETVSVDIDTWKSLHPTRHIDFIFKTDWDMQRKSTNRECEFLTHCYSYNMDASDLHRQFRAENGHLTEIVGYKSANKRYKFIILDHTNMKEYKVTPQYIKNQKDFWKGKSHGCIT